MKRVLIGSFAGPESPKPCSHKTKLRAAIDEWFWVCGIGTDCWRTKMVSSVAVNVTERRQSGFAINI